jgi:hypothetical protein
VLPACCLSYAASAAYATCAAYAAYAYCVALAGSAGLLRSGARRPPAASSSPPAPASITVAVCPSTVTMVHGEGLCRPYLLERVGCTSASTPGPKARPASAHTQPRRIAALIFGKAVGGRNAEAKANELTFVERCGRQRHVCEQPPSSRPFLLPLTLCSYGKLCWLPTPWLRARAGRISRTSTRPLGDTSRRRLGTSAADHRSLQLSERCLRDLSVLLRAIGQPGARAGTHGGGAAAARHPEPLSSSPRRRRDARGPVQLRSNSDKGGALRAQCLSLLSIGCRSNGMVARALKVT